MADTYPKNTIDDNGLKKVWDMVMDRLGLKVDKEAGKGLSTNDYTTTEKNKLAGIASGAEVNTVTSVAGKTGAVTLDKSDVGLGNVGNFKAVSTSANQGLTDTEKSNARANIDTPSNGDVQSSKTVSGNVVTVTDAAPINAEDITVDITPVQDLHGYDRPWAGGAWKNKLNYIDFKGVQGGTVTKSNGTLTITGTNARTGANITDKLVNYLPAGTYTLSFTVTSITNYQNQPTFFGFIVKKSGGAYAYPSVSVSQTGTKSLTYTLSEGDRFERLDFNINDQSSALSNACTFDIKDIQVEEGNQATSYADYENICPIEGRTGAELDRDGKNWFTTDANDYEAGTIDPSTGALLNDSSYKRTKEYLPIRAGSYKLINVYNFRIFLYDSSKNYLGYVDGASVMTISKLNTRFYKARWSAGNDMSAPMLYLSSFTDNTFEPYQGEQYTANFGETVYGGKWHVTEGGTDKTLKNVEYSDSTGIERNNGTQYFCDVSTLGAPMGYLLSNKFKPITDASEQNDPGVCYINADGKIRFNTAKSYDSVTEMIADIGSIQFSYELATPTTINTPKQNVPMLKGINTVSADCGDTQLKYQPDNVVGELKGEIEDNIIYEDFKWTTQSSQSYSAGTPGTYGTSSWRDVKKEGYDVIGVTFVENRRFGDCILTLYYVPSTSHVEVIIFRATSSAVTIADEDIEYRVAYKKA